MLTTDALLDQIISREGGYVDDPVDRGGATRFGVTASTLGEWRHLGRPATRAEVAALAEDEARQIYAARYVQPFAWVPFDGLRAALVDDGVLSGTVTAIRTLQAVLGVPVDGIAGPRTKAALLAQPWDVVTNHCVIQRIGRFVEIVDGDPSQHRFFFGWVRRALAFVVEEARCV